MIDNVVTEADLASYAAAIAGGRLRPEERALTGGKRMTVTSSDRTKLARDLKKGIDHLGDAFAAIRSPEVRRDAGATYTPSAIVNAMTTWAVRQKIKIKRVVDAGAGSGRYAIAAARAFPDAAVVAIEKDPLAALVLRANVVLAGLEESIEIRVEGYHDTRLVPVEGTTLFIGNPPYIRHHDIPAKLKNWYSKSAAAHGVKASQLAGLHLHFFLKTLEIAKPGDIGCFITAAEWLDVNYGGALRKLLLGPLGIRAIDLICPTVPVFDDAMTSAVITAFEIGSNLESVPVRFIKSTKTLSTAKLGSGPHILTSRLAEAIRWGSLVRGDEELASSGGLVGDLFRVRRGQVTGMNAVWVVDPENVDLPESVLRPTVTRARELFDSNGSLSEAAALKAVVDLPADLCELDAGDRKAVEAFLKRAKAAGADQTYIAQHRSPWFAVKLHEPAPILCTYMARRAPAFVINRVGARHINIAHGLYPKVKMDAATLAAVAMQLNKSVSVQSGRTYAGGLTKFEPGEVERLPLVDISAAGTI